MKVFITGTDTGIGKTIVSSWICLHANYDYFKPIQTGSIEGTDSEFLSNIINKQRVHKEAYIYKNPVSPHLAAKITNEEISFNNIKIPSINNLVVEGAGGLMVPINRHQLMIDLIKFLNLSVILVARTTLGTINHTLLSIDVLKKFGINLLGIVLSGKHNINNKMSIEYYGKTTVIAELPFLETINKQSLLSIPLPLSLTKILEEKI